MLLICAKAGYYSPDAFQWHYEQVNHRARHVLV